MHIPLPHISLIFQIIITPSNGRVKLHNEINKLHQKGWGFIKIHAHIIKNGFKIGKSRTTVDSIIKKMRKREEFYSQPILDGIGNFRVELREKGI